MRELDDPIPLSKPFRSFDILKGSAPDTFDARTESTIPRGRTRFLSRQNALLVRGRLLHGGVDRNSIVLQGELAAASHLLHGGVDRNRPTGPGSPRIFLTNGVPCKLGWLRTVTDPSATMARACMANAYPALQKLNAFRFAPESGHAVQRIGGAGQFEPARGIPKLGLGVFFINKRKQPSSGPTATAVQ